MTKSKISDIIYSESERRTKSPQYSGEGVGSQMRLITSFTLFDSASATIVFMVDYINTIIDEICVLLITRMAGERINNPATTLLIIATRG